jgi:endonuclease/exonuclease/phosphatase family metal-dependent hydrolase
MLQRLFPALLCLIAAGVSMAEAQTKENDRPVLTLMTYNIHHGAGTDGKLDLPRIADIIRNAAPDIVCLQEVDRNVPRSGDTDTLQELADLLDMKFVYGKNLDLDGGAYGNAVLSTFPLVSDKNHALPGPENAEPRGCLEVVVETAIGPVTILNTHLGLNAAERLDQARALALLLPEEGPVVLAGDLNEPLSAPGLKHLAEHLSPAETAPDCDQPHTFPAPKPRHRIDHVFTRGGVATSETCVLVNDQTRVASDHYPVMTTIVRAVRPQD